MENYFLICNGNSKQIFDVVEEFKHHIVIYTLYEMEIENVDLVSSCNETSKLFARVLVNFNWEIVGERCEVKNWAVEFCSL